MGRTTALLEPRWGLAAGCVGLLAVLHFLVWADDPRQRERSDADAHGWTARLHEVRRRQADAEAELANRADLDERQVALRVIEREADLVRHLVGLAALSGVSIGRLESSVADPQAAVIELGMDGSYPEVIDFLRRLASDEPLVRIDELTLRRSPPAPAAEFESRVRADLRVAPLRWPEAEGEGP